MLAVVELLIVALVVLLDVVLLELWAASASRSASRSAIVMPLDEVVLPEVVLPVVVVVPVWPLSRLVRLLSELEELSKPESWLRRLLLLVVLLLLDVELVVLDPELDWLCVDAVALRRALTRALMNVLCRAMAASTQLPGVPPERRNVVAVFGSVVVALLVCAQAGSAIRPITSVIIGKRVMDIPLCFADQITGQRMPLPLL